MKLKWTPIFSSGSKWIGEPQGAVQISNGCWYFVIHCYRRPIDPNYSTHDFTFYKVYFVINPTNDDDEGYSCFVGQSANFKTCMQYAREWWLGKGKVGGKGRALDEI